MTRDDIIRLMQEADPEMIINLQDHGGNMEDFIGEDPKLLQFWPFKNYVKFATLVAAAERKAMADIILDYAERDDLSDSDESLLKHLFDLIRARGET